VVSILTSQRIARTAANISSRVMMR